MSLRKLKRNKSKKSQQNLTSRYGTSDLNGLMKIAQGYLKSGRFQEAEKMYKQIISAFPASEAWKSLGLMYTRMMKFNKAIAAYEKVVAANPNDFDVQNKLGILYQKSGNLEVAGSHFQKALRTKPDFLPARFSYAEALEKYNKIEEAYEEVLKGLEFSPNDIELQCLAATCERRLGQVEKALARLSSINENTLSTTHKRQLFFELGRLRHRNKEYEKAYSNFVSGNKAAQQLSGSLKKECTLNRIGILQKQFQESDVLPPVISPLTGRAPVFLIGFPRSGTTLLDQVLDSHPHIQTMEEKDILIQLENQAVDPYKDYLAVWKSLTSQQIKTLQDQYFQEVDTFLARQAGSVLVDRNPNNTIRAALAWRIFPDAKFILAIRHPLDVCLSCFMQDFEINSANVNFFTLSDAVHFYEKVMELWCLFVERLPLNFITVRYEDIVTDLEGEARRLLDFVGVEWDSKVLEFYEHAKTKGQIKTASYHQVTQPIYRHAAYRWKHYEKFCEPFEKQLAPYIDCFGY
ncbi:MAG: sulfotransferase [Desulfobulbaceae bacterium]|nr:sulfotransferase [Desulfobulbaceae bacterium]